MGTAHASAVPLTAADQPATHVLEFSLRGTDDWYRWPRAACTLREAEYLARELNKGDRNVQYRHVPLDVELVSA